MQKARRHPGGLRPLVSTRFQVLFHPAHRGTCHRSVALLVRYRSSSSIQPWRVDPPCSTRVSRDLVYSRATRFAATGLSPSLTRVSIRFARSSVSPLSLAATHGIAVAFFSCAYLDVSVLHVRSSPLYIQSEVPLRVGCPIRISSDRCSFTSSPKLFAGDRVLHRLLTPRHPPCALTAWPHQTVVRAIVLARTPIRFASPQFNDSCVAADIVLPIPLPLRTPKLTRPIGLHAAFLCTRYRLVLTFISHIPMPPGLALPFNTASLAQTCTGQTSNLSGCQRSARPLGSTDSPSLRVLPARVGWRPSEFDLSQTRG